MGTGVYLFYRFDATRQPPAVGLEDCRFSLQQWQPSLRVPWPRGATRNKKLHFLFRTGLQLMHGFASRDSGALALYNEDARLVHYSAFTPRYWRFPFLSSQDLQIGDTWTEPSYRGKGLAKRALREIVARMRKLGRGFWYVVEDINRASIKVVEDCGFRVAGIGTRVERLKGLDYYEIRTQKPSALAAKTAGPWRDSAPIKQSPARSGLPSI
jgi:RimJ/RimL family protein N-acetyltransferase